MKEDCKEKNELEIKKIVDLFKKIKYADTVFYVLQEFESYQLLLMQAMIADTLIGRYEKQNDIPVDFKFPLFTKE